MKRFAFFLTIALSLLISERLQAQTNDEPCTAIDLPISTACTAVSATNGTATASPGVPEPTCTFAKGTNDVWFRLVLTQSSDVVITTQAGTMEDGVMQLYAATDCKSTLKEVACNDDATTGGRMPLITARNLQPGTYFIRVYSLVKSGTFTICAVGSTPLTADFTICDSIVVGLAATTITYTGTALPTAQYYWIFDGGLASPGTGPGPHRVNWSASGPKMVTLTVEQNGIKSESVSHPLTIVATAPRPTALLSTKQQTICGSQTISLPIKLTGKGPWTVTYTETTSTTVVTKSQTVGDGNSCNPSVFALAVTPQQSTTYTVTSLRDATTNNVSQTGIVAIVTVNAAKPPLATFSLSPVTATVGETVTATYTGGATTGANFLWDFGGATTSSGTGSGPYSIVWPSTGLKTVRLVVSQSGCESIPVSNTLVVGSRANVTNDEPCGASILTATASCSYVQASTAGATPTDQRTQAACFRQAQTVRDVWFRFSLAQRSDVVVATQAGSVTDAVMELYNASACDKIDTEPLACEDNNLALMPLISLQGLKAGTYYVRVGGKNSAEGTFGICLQTTVLTPPTAAFTTSKVSLCPGDSASFGITVTGVGPWRVYYNRIVGAQTTGDSVLIGSGLTPSPYTYTNKQLLTRNTSFRIIGVKDDLFERQAVTSNVDIEVQEQPTVTFTVDKTSLSTDQNLVVTFTGSTSANAGYNWLFDGGKVISGSGRGPYSVQWATPGSKSIQVRVVQNSCLSTASTRVVTVTGTNHLDSPCDALELPISSGSCPPVYNTYNTLAATSDTKLNLPACLSGDQRDIWFKFTLPTSQSLILSTLDGTISDPAMQLLSATACTGGSFTTIGCNDDAGFGSNAQISTNLLSAGTYYVRVWNESSSTGSVGVCVLSNALTTTPPAIRLLTLQNTVCLGTTIQVPVELKGKSPWVLTYDEVADGATAVPRSITLTDRASTGTSTLSFPVTLTRPTRYILKTLADATNPASVTVSGVYTVGVLSTSAIVAGIQLNDSITVVNKPLTVQLTGNTDLTLGDRLRWEFNGGISIPGTGTGPHTVTWDQPGPKTINLVVNRGSCPSVSVSRNITVTPLNDKLCEATLLPVNLAVCVPTVAYSSIGATNDKLSLPACGSGTPSDVWFRFELPTARSIAIATTAGTIQSATMQLLTGTSCTGSFTQVACNSGSMPQMRLINLAAGSYYIRLWSTSSSLPTGTFGICVHVLTTPTVRFDVDELAICPGTPVSLPLTLTGSGPWTVNYTEKTAQNTATRQVRVGTSSSPSVFDYRLVVTPTQTTTYRITNVADGVFTTAVASPDSIIVRLSAQAPTTLFSLSPITATTGQELILTYQGNGSQTDIYNWNFDGAVVVAGSATGLYKLKWLSPGRKAIQLQISRGEYCLSAPTTQTLTVTGSHLHDQPCDAVELPVNSYLCAKPITQYSSQSATAGTSLGCYTSGSDVWFKFTVKAGQTITIATTVGTLRDARLQVLSAPASCTGAFTQVACQSSSGASALTDTRLTNLPAGTYYIRVSGNTEGTFGICLGQSLPPTATFLSKDTTFCSGQPNALPVKLTGTGPWVVEYNEVAGSQRLNHRVRLGSNLTYSPALLNLPLSVSATTRLELVGVSDSLFTQQTSLSTVATVQVIPELVANFSSSLTTVATGSPVTFTYSATAVSGAVYSWDFADAVQNTFSGIVPPPKQWQAPGSKNIILTVSKPGCAEKSVTRQLTVTGANLLDEPCQAFALPVRQNNEPGYTFFSNEGATLTKGLPKSTCADEPVNDIWFSFTLTAESDITIETSSGVIDQGAVQLLAGIQCTNPLTEVRCTNESGSTDENALPNLSYNSLPVGTYFIRVGSLGQTGLLGLRVSATPPQPPSVRLNTKIDSVCNGSSLIIPVTITGKGPWTLTYQSEGGTIESVKLGDAASHGPLPFSLTVKPTSSTRYLFRSIADASTPNPRPLTDTLTVKVINVLTSAGVITGSSDACLGVQTYAVQSLSGAAYDWQLTGAGSLSAIGNQASVGWSMPGSYTLTATPFNSCGRGSSSSLVVTVSTIPDKPIIQQNNGLLQSSALTNNRWFFNGDSIQNATATTYLPVQSGTYTVRSFNKCGNSAFSDPVQFILTAIENDPSFIVYPNPASDQLNIKLLNGSFIDGISILSTDGRVVATFEKVD